MMDTTSLIDLSHKLNSNVQVYPGDVPFTCRPIATVLDDGYSVHALSLGSHTGTHIDAPSHFFAEGRTMEKIPLSSLIGPFVRIDLTRANLKDRQIITWDEHIAPSPAAVHIREGAIILLHTGWSEHWGTRKYYDHPFLSRDVAERILARGAKVLGVDTLNPDETPYEGVGGEQGFGVHEVILGAGGIIAENLTNLGEVGEQDMIALIPLNLEGSDGSPVRAFVWKNQNGGTSV